ncbi:endonuclease MutS2 [Prochlorococcus sp. MIT 1300]|uniref:endonuclease MutS2 n=1 Tax=Prochlorococcus sp. MIT 1300 TaxID=3096218 RepID=UPI002A755DC7|nr:endonuclease MutS2 [Prochlorococcus sp. MIT 1300]
MTPLGPAARGDYASNVLQETLELLEWPLLCEHLSSFACTPQGERVCRNLELPADFSTSQQRLLETLEIDLIDSSIEGGLNFDGVHEIRKTVERCHKGGVASGEELLFIAHTLASARRLRRQLDDPSLWPTIFALLEKLSTLPNLEKQLKYGLEEGGRVADRASSSLAGLRARRKLLQEERKSCLQALLKLYGGRLQDSLLAERNGRPVLSIRASASSEVSGLVHGRSSSGHTVFIEPQEVIPLGHRLADLELQIVDEERRLLTIWSQLVGENYFELSRLEEILLKIELALSRARYSKWLGGKSPKLYEHEDGQITLKGFRHPLLMWQNLKEQGIEVMPISIEVPSSLKVVAITGPNTGGKTVTIKSIGLAMLMAKSGLLIPCETSPSLPWCEMVLADIGDEQSIQQNLSTFSGHINRISRILDALNEQPVNALVLLDEVGAGTDPSEGSALARALLSTLADMARLTIATTHFGELKALKYSDSRFENASVAFDSETMSPTYQLLWGIPGRSNALAIAKRLGLKLDIIDQAQELLRLSGGLQVNKIISGLEEQRNRQQAAAEDAAALLARTELLHEELLSHWKQQSDRSAEIQQQARQELANSIREGQREVRKLISRLRADGADGETARQAGQKLRQLELEARSISQRRNQQWWRPEVGDRIKLLALGKSAQVVAISDDRTQVTVLCGVLRSTVPIEAIESLDGVRPTPTPQVLVKGGNRKASLNSSLLVRTSRNTVDVRGLRVHEAEAVIEEYIRGLSGCVWVIHGIGTGRLKRGLRQWLANVPYVERIGDAEPVDGGSGCTVIWLKSLTI